MSGIGTTVPKGEVTVEAVLDLLESTMTVVLPKDNALERKRKRMEAKKEADVAQRKKWREELETRRAQEKLEAAEAARLEEQRERVKQEDAERQQRIERRAAMRRVQLERERAECARIVEEMEIPDTPSY